MEKIEKTYLDDVGTGYFLSKLKEIFSEKSHKHTKSDISDFPTLGTASTKDVASSGNASTSQVVMGNDTRLSDARKASDVSAWAKASTKPTYTASEVGLGNVGNFKAVSTVTSQGLTDAEKSNARTNIGAQVAGSYASASHTHDDRYYTESEIDSKLSGKANSSHTHTIANITNLQSTLDGKASSNHTHSQYLTSHQDISGKLDNSVTGADSLLSKITTSWTAIPTDDTYFIRQDTGGENTFGRVKFSTLWSYIKGKTDKAYAALSHTHTKSQITDFPSSLPANGGNSSTVNGHTVNSDVPANAKFTDTTYSSKSAASGGTDVSLVTTGEKAVWNAKTSNTGTLTGIKMNGASKGTSGVVDLGTVLTGGKQSTTSTVDGGSNIYTFSDGSTITIKNGSKGDPGINATTTAVATTSANGLMSKDMVTKLNSIISGANIIEIWKDTEPTGQPVGSYWIKEY